MGLLPQIDNNLNASISREIKLPSKTYKLMLNSSSQKLIKNNKKEVFGKSIMLNDVRFSKYNIPDISLHGETKQATRSGKNLLPNSSVEGVINGLTFTNNKDGSVTIKGTSTARTTYNINLTNPIALLENVSYVFSKTSNDDIVEAYLRKLDVSELISSIGGTGTYKKFTNAYTGEIFCYIAIPADVTVDTTISVQLEQGTELTEYEQYGVSPSPEFPSEIENVEGKNLFDQRTIFTNAELVLNDKGYYEGKPFPFHPLYGENTDGIPIKKFKELTSYCISFTAYKTVDTSDQASFVVVVYYSDGSRGYLTVKATTPTKYSLKTDSNRTVEKITLTYTYNLDFAIKDFQIEEGTVATKYVPYNSLAVKVTGKNFLNVSSELTVTQPAVWNIPINMPIGTYTLSVEDIVTDGAIDRFLVQFIYEDTNTLPKHLTSTTKTITFTTEKNITKLSIYSQDNYNNSVGITTTYKNLMISKQGGEYEPYKEQTVYFPLAEGQKLMEGSYLADDGVHNKRKQYVLPDATAISEGFDAIANFNFVLYHLPYAKVIQAWHLDFVCDRVRAEMPTVSNETYRGYQTSNSLVILVPKDATLEEVNSKISGSIVEYGMEKEEIIPYTAEQQEVWDELQNIELFDKTNYINSNSLINLKYYDKNNIKIITENQDRIVGYVDDLEAIKQSIYHILNTERYANLIYDDNYGVEFEQYIGKDLTYIKATIEDTLSEALTHDLRIIQVSINEIEQISSNSVLINFTVYSIYGDLIMEVSIDV